MSRNREQRGRGGVPFLQHLPSPLRNGGFRDGGHSVTSPPALPQSTPAQSSRGRFRNPRTGSITTTGRRVLSLAALSSLMAGTGAAQPPQSIIVGAVGNVFHEEFPTDLAFFRQMDKNIALM